MLTGRKEVVPHADFDTLSEPETKESPVTLVHNSHEAAPSARKHSTNSPRPPKARRRRSSTARCGRRLLRRYHEWKSEHMYLGRYSIEKMIAFEEYQRLASPLRVFVVITLTPLPALIVVLLLAAIPLQSPLLPATENPAYFIQSWLSFSAVRPSMRASKVACSPEKSLDVGAIDLGVMEKSKIGRVATIAQGSTTSLTALAMVSPRARQSSIDDTDIIHRHHVKLLSQTLQLVFASEVLIFAEYAEVACAFIFSLYSLVVFHMHNAKYIVPFIGLPEDEFWTSITNSVIYTVLEGCTLLFLFFLVRAKFGFSTLYQLAFMLEKYWMSVQGKIVGSFTLIFVLNIVHQGTNLALKFNWEQILKESPCSS